jgi:hypothetical protein
MQWKVRRPEERIVPTHETLRDSNVLDGAFRTYVWLLTEQENGSIDFEGHAVARGIGLSKLRDQVEQLERAGLVVLNRVDSVMEVQLTNPVALYQSRPPTVFNDTRDELLASLSQSSAERSKAVDERRAAKPFRKGMDREDEERPRKDPKFSSHTLYGHWKDAWSRSFPTVEIVKWDIQSMSIAKNLIARIGPDRATKLVELTIENWTSITRRHNFRGYPTIGWCLKFLDSIGQELLSGQKIGTDRVSNDSRTRALNKGEYDERGATGEKDVGWGDG